MNISEAHSRSNLPFCKLEIAFAHYCHGKESHKVIGDVLGRSRASITKLYRRRLGYAPTRRLREYAKMDADKAAYILANYNDMTQREITKVLGLGPTAVGKFLHRRGLVQRRSFDWPYSSFGSIRKKVIDRNGAVCAVCGYSNVVHVHHIDENRENNSEDNLIVLCPNHHAEIHSGIMSIDDISEP